MIQQRPFREFHLLRLLKNYDSQDLPLDLIISNYFRFNKALGSKDRGEIAETAYQLVRQKGLLDYLCLESGATEIDWEKRLDFHKKEDLKSYLEREDIPLHIRYSFPESLWNLIVGSHGLEKGRELCRISNLQAPTTVRVNLLKTNREEMLKRWQEQYEISPCRFSKEGIVFNKKIALFSLPEFKEGLFEVQDEGSQLLAHLVEAQAGQLVMDFCSGSGGKTLAFAPLMGNKGQIFLHDIRPFALQEAKKRLKRAGIQNAQMIHAEETDRLKKLKKQMHWVLVDAPCTGTGTIRRNPDMKWKFHEETLTRLVGQQRTIFEKALSYMRPDGRIIYGTCSLLKEENQEQVAHFLKTYDLEVVGESFQTLPAEGEMDGFFGVVMKKTLKKDILTN